MEEAKNLSCLQCRKRKIRCDRKSPCNPCSMRGAASSCCQITRSVVTATAPTREDAHEPTDKRECPREDDDRIERLEQRIEQMEKMLAIASASSESTVPAPSHDDVPGFLEDVAMGHRLKRRSCKRSIHEVDEENPLSQRSAVPAVDVAFQFLELCPQGRKAELLVDFYFAHVDWCTRVLHPQQSRIDFGRVARMSAGDASIGVHSGILCCYLAVLALALHFADDECLQSIDLAPQDATRLADTLCSGSQQLLWASNFLQSRQMEHLACVNLLGVYQHNRKGQADAYWALVGAAIKVAINLGLSRIDHPGSSGSSSIGGEVDREMGRRIWWNLLWYDYSQASAHYGCYCVHPLQNRTDVPHNVDIHGDDVSAPQPIGTHTQSSATIVRMQYVEVYRQSVDCRNKAGRLSRSDVSALARKIDDIHQATPVHLYKEQAGEDSCRASERIMLELMFHNRHLRLHRDGQFAGYSSKEWSFARTRTVDAAKQIILILSEPRCAALPLFKFWLVTLYLLGASTALLMELLCANDLGHRDRTKIEELVEMSISLLSRMHKASDSAQRSRRILRRLFAAREQVRQVSGHSQSMDTWIQAVQDVLRHPVRGSNNGGGAIYSDEAAQTSAGDRGGSDDEQALMQLLFPGIVSWSS